MNYKIKIFLSLCFVGSIKSSDFGASCSSNEFEDNIGTQAIVACAVVRSAESVSPREIENKSLQIHKIEQEIDEFQRCLRRKTSGLQSEYEKLSNNPKFLTDKKFVEANLGPFVSKVEKDKQSDQERFNELSKKVSSLRGSFRTKLSEEKNILSEDNPVDSLIGSLRVVARDHGFTENPFLQVPSLKLNGSKVHFKSGTEEEYASGLSLACNLGSGIRQVESTTDDQPIVANSKRFKKRSNFFTLQEDYVDGTFLEEDTDASSDNSLTSSQNRMDDNSLENSIKESSKPILVATSTKKPKSKKMNDDDSE